MRRLASAVFLATSIVIGLGAFGHGSNVGGVEAELAKFPALNRDTAHVLIAVWYFVSGAMVLSSLTCLWAWRAMRRGDRSAAFLAALIGTFNVVTGVATVSYTGIAFFWTFVILGALLLASTAVLWAPPRG